MRTLLSACSASRQECLLHAESGSLMISAKASAPHLAQRGGAHAQGAATFLSPSPTAPEAHQFLATRCTRRGPSHPPLFLEACAADATPGRRQECRRSLHARRPCNDASACSDYFPSFATISSVSFCTSASTSASLDGAAFVIGLNGVTGDEQPCEPHICVHGSTSQRLAGLRS